MRKTFILLLIFILSNNAFSTNYYFSTTGNNGFDGKSPSQAWASFNKLQSVFIQPGDSILIKSGNSFLTTDNISLSKWVFAGIDGIMGTGDDFVNGNVPVSSPTNFIVITTYPSTGAAANITFLKDTTGINIYNVQGIKISNLNLIGIGAANAPKYNGISIYNEDSYGTSLNDTLKNYVISKMNVSGFKDGVAIGSWQGRRTSGITIDQTTVNDNFTNGIKLFTDTSSHIANVNINYCNSYNNSGDPSTALTTGNGISIDGVNKGLIENCIAHNNGGSCTASQGPSGIRSFNSSNIVIQYCESYDNKTAAHGFDMDGGSQQCTIQYCYSHGNDGSGFLIFQSSGARAFISNTIRYNISQNDGANGYGSIQFYSAGSTGGIKLTEVYNNTVYNSVSSAVKFQVTSGITGVKIRNNIFQTNLNKTLIIGNPATSIAKFENNAYWNNGGTFSFAGYSTLAAWQTGTGQEKKGTVLVGMFVNPQLNNPGNGATINNVDYLDTLSAYKLKLSSPLLNAGQNLTLISNGELNVGTNDFFDNSLPYKGAYDIGAHEYSDTWPSFSGFPKTLYIDGLKNSSGGINITSNVSYKLSYTASWLSADAIIGSGNKTITYTATEDNMTGLERSVKIIISKNDASVASSDTITVIQRSAFSVSFNITDIDNIPIRNAEVKIGSKSVLTDINGKANFIMVGGTYSYSITKIGIEEIAASPFIIGNANLSFQVKVNLIKYKVSFYVNDGGNPLGNASLSVGSVTNYSSGSGYASFLLDAGTYNYNVTKGGFYTIPNSSFSVQKDTVIDVLLTPTPASVFNVTFRVMEGTTPISNATVSIDTIQISTSTLGEATFTLSNADYYYSIRKIGFDSIDLAKIRIQGKDTIVESQLTELGFPITISVTDGTDPMKSALVEINKQIIATDDKGQATFILLDGSYSYTVSMDGYISIPATSFTVMDNAEVIIVAMIKNTIGLNSSDASITIFPNPTTGYITITGGLIKNSTVVQVYSVSGELLSSWKTNEAENFSTDMSTYSSGIYVIKITSTKGSKSFKVTKE